MNKIEGKPKKERKDDNKKIKKRVSLNMKEKENIRNNEISEWISK